MTTEKNLHIRTSAACRIFALLFSMILCAGTFAMNVFAMPVLDTENTSEGVNVTVDGTTMHISAPNENNNVINWASFDIGSNETVIFDNNNNYINLIRNSNAFKIDGSLEGGNNIYLVNPNGMIFGNDCDVRVGNLYVPTHPDSANLTGSAISGGFPTLWVGFSALAVGLFIGFFIGKKKTVSVDEAGKTGKTE